MSEKVYITTAIPYVNGIPHVGHAMDYLLADVCGRYYKLSGKEVRIQAGTDEHGNKIFQKAKELGVPTQEYVDENAKKFQDFIKKLGVEYTDFVRTTDKDHEKRVQKIWTRMKDHIYLSKYEGWYCTGCERFITDKEYEENNGVCPDHQKPYEKLVEENYYFRISDFKEQIREAILSHEMLILPEFREKEILRLLDESPDVSISRPREQLTWGVPVPDDENQVMYVWIDALSNYITVLGYPEKDIADFWPAYAQFVGKDILRFHAIIWPAMLLALGLPLPKTLVSHGMVLSDGQKMSKSIGNVIDPIEVLDKHGTDAFRYYFLRHVDTFADSDFTWEKFENAYNNELANDLGNLVQRLATLCQKNGFPGDSLKLEISLDDVPGKTDIRYDELMEEFKFKEAFDLVWEEIQALNRKIDEDKPWSLAKNGQTDWLHNVLRFEVTKMLDISHWLKPFLPETAKKIEEIFWSKTIEPPKEPLFPKN
ncbi:methionine--tRNA ligase [Candidatus Saccharibacteria bacterium]|nr:methionine--tRNA ligase [Candidatus Saccharibacteria bacterium]